MPMRYPHLTHPERSPISALQSTGRSLRQIAAQLGHHVSPISRELSRHRGPQGYRHSQAQGKATARRREASSVPRRMIPECWAVGEERLRTGSGSTKLCERRRVPVPAAAREEIELAGRSTHGTGSTSRSGGHHRAPGNRGGKSRTGDWELDTIIGARHWGALISWVDQASRYTVLEPVGEKTEAAVTEAIVRHLEPIRDRVHTYTADHGKEFAGHRETAEALDVGFDFATLDPSWERGLNEPIHGRVRQSFPKGTDCLQGMASQVRAVADRIHPRPRKRLGIRTLQQVFTAAAPPWRWSLLPHLGSPCLTGRVPLGRTRPETARADPCVGEGLLSDSPGVEMNAINGRNQPLGVRNVPVAAATPHFGLRLIPGSRRVWHFGVEVGL